VTGPDAEVAAAPVADPNATGTTGLVLLHGSELGAWLWDDLLPSLSAPAVAVELPGRGSRPTRRRDVTLDDAVAAVVADADGLASERLVLVAHSFAGILTGPVAARLGDRVVAAVFIAGTVPIEGRSWVDLQPRHQQVLLRVLYRLRPDGVLSPASQNRTTLCHDLDEATTDRSLEQRVPEAPRLLLDRVSPAALPPHVAAHYVRLTEDRAVSQAEQATAAARLGGAQVHELASGHLPMLGRPGELAALLDRIAAGSGGGAPG
jgi:pimeloyl-ACP methyl ester carboxylesterase